jgi:hypothetical protein
MFYIQWLVGQFGFMESENKYQISIIKAMRKEGSTTWQLAMHV